MDPAYIKPFIASIQDVFSTMLQLPLQIGEPKVKDAQTTSYDVSGIIGMSGDVTGSVVLSFPSETAERIVSILTGQDVGSVADAMPDAVGELVNMISGGAKGRFNDRAVSISCPSVVMGSDHKVTRPKDVPCIVIPCETDCGALALEISIQDRRATESSASASAAAA